MEFEDLNGAFCEVGGIFQQLAGEGFPQKITLLFNTLPNFERFFSWVAAEAGVD